MFFNMLSPSVTSRNEFNTSTSMFEPGAKVGDMGKYIKNTPYTVVGSGFSQGDWYIVDMSTDF